MSTPKYTPNNNQPNSTHWRDIDVTTQAGRIALCRVIAEFDGWIPHDTGTGFKWTKGEYSLGVEFTADSQYTIDDAWREVWRRDRFKYTEETDTALSLIDRDKLHIQMQTYKNGWLVFIDETKGRYRRFHEVATTLPIAICMVWLDYIDPV